jgi:hypothetical protein
MPIELKITGNHATDIVAEVQTLAEILGVGTTPAPAPVKAAEAAPTKTAEKVSAKVETAPAPTGTASEGKKTLSRKEQDEAVAEMIAAGEKDDRFDLLTKGRQNEVEAALAKAAESEKSDVDDMFDDEPAAEVVTREMVSKLMGATCKDANGQTIQDKGVAVRAILVDAIPEGQEIKVANVPEDKLAEVYAAIQKIGA